MENRKTHVAVIASALTLLASVSPVASAALITIMDPLGNSDFTVTYDDTQTGPFGTPFLSNNTVYFLPNDFTAQSSSGLGMGELSDSFILRLDAIDPNVTLSQFNLEEQGDYILNGADATVSAEGNLSIYADSDPGSVFLDTLETGPLTTQSPDFTPVDWVGTASIGESDGWTASGSVWLTIENFLFANTTANGSYAFIEKKYEGIAIEVTAVPLPAAVWMFATALLTLVRRR